MGMLLDALDTLRGDVSQEVARYSNSQEGIVLEPPPDYLEREREYFDSPY